MDTSKALITFLLAAALSTLDAAATNLTLHNLCPYPIWPLITQNIGLPAITDDIAAGRLGSNGEGLTTLTFPPGAWSGRVVARTACSDDAQPKCDTGDAPPVTVAQVSVHGPAGLAEYSVSLVDGFNVPVVITPHGFEQGRQCPALGCAVDLDADCPRDARAPAGGCKASARFFKERCPDTRTTATDVEATPQRCLEPGELKVVFCPSESSLIN